MSTPQHGQNHVKACSPILINVSAGDCLSSIRSVCRRKLSPFSASPGGSQVGEQETLKQSTNCQRRDLSVLEKKECRRKALGNLTMGKANCLTVWLSYLPDCLSLSDQLTDGLVTSCNPKSTQSTSNTPLPRHMAWFIFYLKKQQQNYQASLLASPIFFSCGPGCFLLVWLA